MRGISLLLVGTAGLLSAGCSAYGNFPTHHSHLSASAERILSRSVRDIRGWTKEDRVAIVNLDSVLVEDESIPALVTDALISAVVESGVAVVERDSDALRWVAQEGSGERISYGATGYSKDADQQLVIDAELMGARRYVPGTRYLLDGENYIEVPPGTDLMELGPDPGDDRVTRVPLPKPPTITNNVLTATKLLQFRIVDISVREEPRDEDILRHANVVLVLRLVDAKYGTVVWSGLVQEVMTDEVPAALAAQLRRASPDSPSKAAPDSHAAWGSRLWKRPSKRNTPDKLILCCSGEDASIEVIKNTPPKGEGGFGGLTSKPAAPKAELPAAADLSVPSISVDRKKIMRIALVGVGTVVGISLESKAIQSFKESNEYKEQYESSTNELDAETYRGLYQDTLLKGVLLGVAGVGVLSGTGVFLATKVISVEPGTGSLVFSATW